MTDFVIVLTTIAENRADELAQTLVQERLAACVNVLAPMMSTYRWNGRVEREPERQLFIKTMAARLPQLQARLRELHPYELPEFVVIEGTPSEAYLLWVKGETEPA